MNRRGRVGLLAVLLLGGASGLTAIFIDWHIVLTRYRAWRLDAARTTDEARPWLDAIAGDADLGGATATVVGLLGAHRPQLTYWIFWRFLPEGRVELSLGAGRFPERAADALPWILAIERRREGDAAFREVWAHFIRWRGSRTWYVLDQLSDLPAEPRPKGMIGRLAGTRAAGGAMKELAEYLERDPRVFEAGVRWINLCYLGEAMSLGMSPLPVPPAPVLVADASGRLRDLTLRSGIAAWIEANAGGLPQVIAVPETPLPGWEGPVPRDGTPPAQTAAPQAPRADGSSRRMMERATNDGTRDE